jgi:PAS domain-containing protein
VSARARRLSPPVASPPDPPGVPEGAWAAIVEAMPFPVLIADMHGRFLGGNSAAARLLGCSWDPPEAAADYYAESTDARQVQAALLDAGPDGAKPIDITLRTVAGKKIPARLFGVALRDAGGTPVATAALFVDRTADLKAQAEFQDAIRRAVVAERRTGHEDQGRKFAHEVNQPLTVAMGQLEMLLAQPGLPEVVEKRIGKVQEQLQRVADSIRRFRQEGREGK